MPRYTYMSLTTYAMQAERRRMIRADLAMESHVLCGPGRVRRGTVLMLSPQGLVVDLPMPLDDGTALAVCFADCGWLRARVAWSLGSRIICRFTEPLPYPLWVKLFESSR